MAVLIWPSQRARAQAWLADRARSEGAGIRAGDLEFHPGVGAEVGYDSNVFLRDGTDNSVAAVPPAGGNPGTTGFVDHLPEGSAILRVTPHLFVSTLGDARAQDGGGAGAPPTVEFRGGVSVPVYHYFSAPNRSRAEATVDLALRVLPERPVSFGVLGTYERTIRPFTDGPTNAKYGLNTIDGGPQVRFRTNGGVLQVGVGGNLRYQFFDDTNFGVYDSTAYRADVDAAWKFLPQTALVYDAALEHRNVERGSSGSTQPLRVDSNRYQFRMGVNGALTATISATLMVGYGALFFQGAGGGGADSDGALAMAQLKWIPSETAKVILGYDRTGSSAFQGNYQWQDRVSLEGNLLFAGALMLGATASVSRVAFGFDAGANTTDARTDIRVRADVNTEYRLADWVAMTASAGVFTNVSNHDFVSQNPMVTLIDPVEFTRFDAFLGLRVFY